MVSHQERVARAGTDKFTARRDELATSALATLAERGYARTGLRDIAQNSEFSHGVLHYYFRDKDDLIQYCVRKYKNECATHYDQVVDSATTTEELARGFAGAMAETLRDDASMHRLWYDIRNQSLFQAELTPLAVEIDGLLEQMIWRVLTRYAALGDGEVVVEPAMAYAMYDGLFERSLAAFLRGDLDSLEALRHSCSRMLDLVVR